MPRSNGNYRVDLEEDYLDAIVAHRTKAEKLSVDDPVITASVTIPDKSPGHGAKAQVERSKQVDTNEAQASDNKIVQERYFDKDNDNDIEKQNRKKLCTLHWYICAMTIMTLVLVAMFAYGFGSGLFLPQKNLRGNQDELAQSNEKDSSSLTEGHVNRLDYKYNIATLLGLPKVLERSSAQALAIDWLAFNDEPLFDPAAILSEDQENNVLETLLQRYALVVWYFEQGGPTVWKTFNREVSSGWIEFGAGIHVCDWRGVDCDYNATAGNASGRVIGLSLSPALGLVLTGSSLSTELGLLTSLRHIDFSDQRLQGEIPDEWSALSNLETVILSKNKLYTTIPSWIEKWTSLEHLALDGNGLYGTIPSALGSFQKLKYLKLDTNPQLQGRFDDTLFPPTNSDASTGVGPRGSLEFLDLSNTDLEGELPQTSLPYLKSLRLWNTRGLEGSIPSEIGTWSNLESLSIKDSPNLLGSIPTELGLLTNLQILEIYDSNNMSGELPSELGNLSSKLRKINFRYLNQSGSLPVEWASLEGLERLDLVQNVNLEGTVPPEYSELSKLQSMDIRGTNLTGEVPGGVCALESLEELKADCSMNNDKSPGKIICLCCTWCSRGNSFNSDIGD